MANRKQRAETAAATVSILERGTYSVDGQSVDVSRALEVMRNGTKLYTPKDIDHLLQSLEPLGNRKTKLEVANCTTFAAAKTLIDEGCENPICLNFASAKNPGGGFLSGSQAQEECLARASGLYWSLTHKMDYYEINRACKSSLYTNHLIYSPNVPVFRNDHDELLPEPYLISIVTSPAVNAGAIRKNEPQQTAKIRSTMEHRIRSVLSIARKHNHNSIVLGAWGCGVFQNKPCDIANWFRVALTDDRRFHNQFDRIIFAVLDFADGTPTFNAFRETIPENGG